MEMEMEIKFDIVSMQPPTNEWAIFIVKLTPDTVVTFYPVLCFAQILITHRTQTKSGRQSETQEVKILPVYSNNYEISVPGLYTGRFGIYITELDYRYRVLHCNSVISSLQREGLEVDNESDLTHWLRSHKATSRSTA